MKKKRGGGLDDAINHLLKETAATKGRIGALAFCYGEDYKHLAQDDLAKTESPVALLRWIESHYLRSLKSWLLDDERTDLHPGFVDYAGAWLEANGSRVSECQAVEALRALFPSPDFKGLDYGASYWRGEQE